MQTANGQPPQPPQPPAQLLPQAAPPAPPADLDSICRSACRDVPDLYADAVSMRLALDGAAHSLRRALVGRLCATLGEDSVRHEDFLRALLPPLRLEPLVFSQRVVAWRLALAAALGLLLGLGLGQGVCLVAGLFAAQPYGNALTLATGVGCAAFFVWGARELAVLRAQRPGDARAPTGIVGRLARWLRPWFLGPRGWRGWLAVAVMALARDMWLGGASLDFLTRALLALYEQGYVLPLFANVFSLLVWLYACTLALDTPPALPPDLVVTQARLAARNWWEVAAVAAERLLGREAMDAARLREGWQELGHQLYSFARELAPAQRDWLTERLRGLGVDILDTSGPLRWTASMAEQFDPVGLLREGDPCYVDTPPLLENGVLVRKGAMRKVR